MSNTRGKDKGQTLPSASELRKMEVTAYMTDLLKEVIIGNLEEALRKQGLEPNKALMQELRESSYETVTRIAVGFPGYIVSEIIKKMDPNIRTDKISLL